MTDFPILQLPMDTVFRFRDVCNRDAYIDIADNNEWDALTIANKKAPKHLWRCIAKRPFKGDGGWAQPNGQPFRKKGAKPL